MAIGIESFMPLSTVLSPHVGGSILQSIARMHPIAAQNVLTILAGRNIDVRAVANPEVLQ